MRIIEISDSKLKKALQEKEKLITKGRKIQVEIEKLQTKQNKLGLQVQKIKDDVVMPTMKAFKKDNLGRYEDFNTVKVENGKVVVEVMDYIEEYTKQLDEQIHHL